MRHLGLYSIVFFLLSLAANAGGFTYQWEQESRNMAFCYKIDPETNGQVVHEYVYDQDSSGCTKALPKVRYIWELSDREWTCYQIDQETSGVKFHNRVYSQDSLPCLSAIDPTSPLKEKISSIDKGELIIYRLYEKAVKAARVTSSCEK